MTRPVSADKHGPLVPWRLQRDPFWYCENSITHWEWHAEGACPGADP